MRESMFSNFTYIVLAMIVRGKETGEFTPEMLSDVTSLFSSKHDDKAISADVPTALNNLAMAVIEDGVTADQLEVEHEGLALIKNGEHSSVHFDRFMSLHGHRGSGEVDFISKTWSDHPELLLHTVKGMVANPSTLKSGETYADIDTTFDSLRTLKVAGAKRWFMKLLLRQSHRAVALREECKNYVVQGSGNMRANIHVLGKQLVEQGYLPEFDLIFFFTIPELHEFIESRAPRLISRAMRRKKNFPTFKGKRYEYFWQGPGYEIPEPSVDLLKSTSLSGTTVCEGVAV
ncbi:hypothetical protein PMAYCL1PPCAC_32261, partial [Pristionchus mayeri]